MFVCKKGKIYKVCHIGSNFVSIEIDNSDGYQDTMELGFDELEFVE